MKYFLILAALVSMQAQAYTNRQECLKDVANETAKGITTAKSFCDVNFPVKVKQVKQAEQVKKPGVRLGMSEHQVINETSWGKPKWVNNVVNPRGKLSQWAYGNGNYLIFVDGVLVEWQN